MKVLRLAPYITNSNLVEHSKRYTGFGRSVWDISRYSAKSGNEEYLFTFRNSHEKIHEDVCLLQGGKSKLIRHMDIGTLIEMLKGIPRLLLMKGVPFRIRLSYFLSNSASGYLETVIKEMKPDIIHIHGLTYQTLSFVRAAKKSGVPYLVTLHGLNMNALPSELERNFEKRYINLLNKDNIYITIIGSGMYKTIKANCTISNPEKIVTINHGIDKSTLETHQNIVEIKQRLNRSNKKMLISVGSLIDRKNHISLIRAISKLTMKEKQSIIVYIIGEGPLRSKLQKEIDDLDLSNTIYLEGHKSHKELSEYYSIADFSILLSHIEGFGRPFLESYMFGVPVLTFNDLDAIEDLYIEKGMYLIEERTLDSIVSKIREVINIGKDSLEIKKYSETKTWSAAISKYNKVYQDILRRN